MGWTGKIFFPIFCIQKYVLCTKKPSTEIQHQVLASCKSNSIFGWSSDAQGSDWINWSESIQYFYSQPPTHAKLTQQVSLSIIYGLYRWNCLHARKQCLPISSQDPSNPSRLQIVTRIELLDDQFFFFCDGNIGVGGGFFWCWRNSVCKDFGGTWKGLSWMEIGEKDTWNKVVGLRFLNLISNPPKLKSILRL